MFAFLDRYWQISKSEDIGDLLSSMDWSDGLRPNDPAMWSDWIESCDLAKREHAK